MSPSYNAFLALAAVASFGSMQTPHLGYRMTCGRLGPGDKVRKRRKAQRQARKKQRAHKKRRRS